LAPSAIRFYESRGLISARRTEGGQRVFDAEAELSLRQLQFAQSSGFTLSEIAELLGPIESGEPLFNQWRSRAEEKLRELDAVIAQAREMKHRLQQAIACRCTDPAECGLLAPGGGES